MLLLMRHLVQVLHGFNATAVPLTDASLVHQCFARCAVNQPGAACLVYEGETMSYGEVRVQALCLGRVGLVVLRHDCDAARLGACMSNVLLAPPLQVDAVSNRLANTVGMRPNDEFYLMGRVPRR